MKQKSSACLLIFAICTFLAGCWLDPMQARADAAGDKRRVQFAKVRVVAVLPPFFGTTTLYNAEDPGGKRPADGNAVKREKGDADRSHDPESVRRAMSYREQLRKLEEHAVRLLPERVQERTAFQIIVSEDLQRALKALNLTPRTLFQNQGLIRGTKYAQPDATAVKRLAAHLKADALLLTVFDEPRRTNSRYYFDPLDGISYDSAHVRGKAAFFVLLADGTEALHDYPEVLHPLTKIANRNFLFVDWMETEDQLIEGFLDEWTRYTPAK